MGHKSLWSWIWYPRHHRKKNFRWRPMATTIHLLYYVVQKTSFEITFKFLYGFKYGIKEAIQPYMSYVWFLKKTFMVVIPGHHCFMLYALRNLLLEYLYQLETYWRYLDLDRNQNMTKKIVKFCCSRLCLQWQFVLVFFYFDVPRTPWTIFVWNLSTSRVITLYNCASSNLFRGWISS